MLGRTPTRPPGRATSRAGVTVACLIAGIALSGCARMGMPVGVPDTDRTFTNSVNSVRPATAVALADPSDWETIRRALASALDAGSSGQIDWSNPDTGSFGVIVAAAAANGAGCRPFDTTMSDVRGVRRYSGEVCKMTNGRWALRSVRPADAALS
jgi:surface antigen